MPIRAQTALPCAATPLILILSAGLLLACQSSKSSTKPAPDPVPPPRQVDTIAVRDVELEQRAARLQWRVLEKEAEVEELQSQLDEAQREVVRVMARLQTLATRAEAASAIAEAEVAVQPLASVSGAGAAADAAQAKRLLTMAGTEFNRQNFGGALYLASQAKTLAGRSRPPTEGQVDMRRDEVRFAVPLRLSALSQSNVRDGPGTNFKVLFVLERGIALTGLGYAADWVRVGDPTGRSGWIRQDLVGPRARTP